MLLCVAPSFVVLPGTSTHNSYGGVNSLNSVPYRRYTYVYRSSPLVAIRMYSTDHRHVSLVHVNTCSFAVSQASDLALLVGFVA